MKIKTLPPCRMNPAGGVQTISCASRITPSPWRRLCGVLFLFIMAARLGSASFAQTPPGAAGPAAPAGKKFSIGFLSEGSDLKNAPVLLENLRQYLLNQPVMRRILAGAGYDDVILSPCGEPRDMAQRMGEDEFELVFANPAVYAGYPRQTAHYEPILQTHRPGDINLIPSREAGVYRQGVVFIGPHCAYFNKPKLTAAEKHDLLQHSPMAVPSADSAVGYLAPRYKLLKDYGLRKMNFLFCGSDLDVVRHVVSGLVDVGACSEGALTELIGKNHAPYLRIILLTDPAPTDPILINRNAFANRSDVGDLKAALREFFRTVQKSDDSLLVEDASKRAYERLAVYLQEFDEGRVTTVPPRPAASGAAHPPAKEKSVGVSSAPASPKQARPKSPAPRPLPPALPDVEETSRPTPALPPPPLSAIDKPRTSDLGPRTSDLKSPHPRRRKPRRPALHQSPAPVTPALPESSPGTPSAQPVQPAQPTAAPAQPTAPLRPALPSDLGSPAESSAGQSRAPEKRRAWREARKESDDSLLTFLDILLSQATGHKPLATHFRGRSAS